MPIVTGCIAGVSLQTIAAPFRNESTPTLRKVLFGNDVGQVRSRPVHFAVSHAPWMGIVVMAIHAFRSTQTIVVQRTLRFNGTYFSNILWVLPPRLSTYQFDSWRLANGSLFKFKVDTIQVKFDL